MVLDPECLCTVPLAGRQHREGSFFREGSVGMGSVQVQHALSSQTQLANRTCATSGMHPSEAIAAERTFR